MSFAERSRFSVPYTKMKAQLSDLQKIMTSHLAMSNNTRVYEEFELLMPRWGYVASAFVLFVIGFFGFFLNLMVILLMFKDRQLWTPLNIILFNLVCSDFSVSVLGNPFTLISALFHGWVFGHTMCVLYGFFMALLGITSITTLTVISFERYMLVTRPFSSRHLSTKGAGLSVLFIWTYSLALTTPPLMGWGNYVSEAANISCSVNWHEQTTNTLTYILFLFAFGQMVPFAVISFSYINIIRTMKKNSQRLRRVNRAEGRATTMVFVMVVAFTVAWTPYSVFALMEQFTINAIISPGVGVIPALVAKSSICYNPLIYVGMNSQFRQSIKRIFGIHNQAIESSKYANYTSSAPQKAISVNETNTKINSNDCNIPANEKQDRKVIILEQTTENRRAYFKDVALTNIEKEHQAIEYDNSQRDVSVYSELQNERSPIINIESDRVAFSKNSRKTKDRNTAINVYKNQAYEDHSTDTTDVVCEMVPKTGNRPNITHSRSLDLGRVLKGELKKLNNEGKLETACGATADLFTRSFKFTVIRKP